MHLILVIDPFAQESLLTQHIDRLDGNVDLTATTKQGQFVKRVSDGTNLVLQPATLNTDGPDVRGVAMYTLPQESLPAGSGAPTGTQSPATYYTGGVHMMRGKLGQTFTPGDALVIDEGNADGQTVRLQGADAFTNVVAEVANTDKISAGTTFGVVGDGVSFNVPCLIAPPGLGRNNGTVLIF
jgi:hypothetical protein